MQNERLRENGIDARVDHRTLEAQGIEREPTRHLGPSATGFERRTGEPSRKRLDFEQDAAERLAELNLAVAFHRALAERAIRSLRQRYPGPHRLTVLACNFEGVPIVTVEEHELA